MTAAELAEALSCDVRTVHRMTKDGRLKPVGKLPGKTGAWLYRRSDLDALLSGDAKAAS